MKHLLYLILLLFSLPSCSQGLHVESMQKDKDQALKTDEIRKDLFNTPCALIKVQIDDEILRVDGNTIGNVVDKGAEKWIYVTEGTKRIDIVPKNHLPISIVFPKLGIDEVEPSQVFTLILKEEDDTEQDAETLYQLGYYATGIGGTKDFKKAAEYYEKAAAKGNLDAKFELACFYNEGIYFKQDKIKATAMYEELAQKNHIKSQYNLSIFYRETNLQRANYWLEKAAENNSREAQFNLGACYYYGLCGYKLDYSKAIPLFLKAADQEYAPAQYDLGICYHNGTGVEKNLGTAISWYKKAAAQDYIDAYNNMGICYEKLGDNVEAAMAYMHAAEAGSAIGQYNYGNCYFYGRGLQKNQKEGISWYIKSAEQGDASAQYDLGVIYFNGNGIDRDYSKAFYYYQKAAEQNNSSALNNLGYCYENGFGVPKDKIKALECYRKSSALGDETATANLNRLTK